MNRDLTPHSTGTATHPYQYPMNDLAQNPINGFAVFNQEGTITQWDFGMSDITGVAAEHAIGGKIWDVFDPLRLDEEKQMPVKLLEQKIRLFLAEKESRPWAAGNRFIKRINGQLRYIELWPMPIRLPDNLIFVCLAKDLTENIKSGEIISKQKNQAEALLRITAHLNSNSDLKKALHKACQEVSRILDAKMAGVVLDGKTGEGVCLATGDGLPDKHEAVFTIPPKFFRGRARYRGSVAIVRDIQRCKGMLQAVLLKEMNVRTVVSAHILHKAEYLGSLNIYFTGSPRTFSEDDLDFIHNIAIKFGITIFNSQLSEREKQLRKQLKRLSGQILAVREEERKRISRELHDEVGQALTALKFNLSLLRNGLGKIQGQTYPQIDEALELTNDILRQIHFLTRDLRPPVMEKMGLNLIFRDYCTSYSTRMGINVSYSGEEIPGLNDTFSICLYRLLQESLTNVAKHSKAKNVRVGLKYAKNQVEFSIRDDGQGFYPEKINDLGTDGIGIISMKERIEILGGKLTIRSGLGQGTVITALVPLEELS